MEHAFKLDEKILDGRLLEVVDIDKMHGFMPGRGSVDAVFIPRRLTEKFRTKNKLIFVFANLEKAFDQVPREVICFALRQKGIPEYLVHGLMPLYKGCKTAISVDFSVNDGVHQGSALSSLLFIIIKGCSNRRCETWFINRVVVCGRYCFVWGNIK